MLNTGLAHAAVLLVLSTIAYPAYGSLVGSVYLHLAGLACFLFVSFQVASYVDNALPRFRVSSTRKAVFVTGCDRGFGRLVARRLDSLGYRVFAGCLDPKSDDVRQLTDTTTSHLVIVELDVTNDESVQKAVAKVENELGDCELWALVNNAGVIERGELEWTPLEKVYKQFEVNTFGVMRVTQACLPLLRKTQGRVVTIASIGGRQTFSGFVPYCMSKAAVISFCDGLRLEMKKFGVKVISIEPFSYQTNMTEMNTVLDSAKKNWTQYFSGKAPQQPYDERYLTEFTSSVRKFNEATALADSERVVDLIVEGVCAISPHYSYVPGDLYCLTNLWLSRRAPKTIVDEFVRKFITFDKDLEKFLETQKKKT